MAIITTINADAQVLPSVVGGTRRRLRGVECIKLHDIRRQATAQSLVPCIIEGLRATDRESPSLLLWNDRGLSLFDAVLDSPHYYPATREWSLLRNEVHGICSSLSSGDRLIELGAGNMKKTALILHTLQSQRKQIQYIACDVDRSALRRCIRELQAMFPAGTSGVSIQGLLGTYEDCAAWLRCNRSIKARTTLMWIGNSMANFTPDEASEYIRAFLSSGSRMIVGLDGCRDQEEISRSYNGPANREFVLNGLPSANQLLDAQAFDLDEWEFEGRWNSELCMHEAFYVAQRDLTVRVCGQAFTFNQGDTMRSIRSGKWPREKVTSICEKAGGCIQQAWLNEQQSYGIYLLGSAST